MTLFRVFDTGKVSHRSLGRVVSGMHMSGWEEGDGPCSIEGSMLGFIPYKHELALIPPTKGGDDVLSVDGQLFTRVAEDEQMKLDFKQKPNLPLVNPLAMAPVQSH